MDLKREVLHTIENLGTEVSRLASALLGDEQPQVAIGLTVVAIHGRRPLNIDRGSIDVVDTEKVLLSVAAKDLGGAPRTVPADEFLWESSNTAAVALEDAAPNPDGTPGDPYTRWARTPTPGAALVTVTHAPTGNTETLSITVKVSGPGEIGLSAGTPVAEEPAAPPPPTP